MQVHNKKELILFKEFYFKQIKIINDIIYIYYVYWISNSNYKIITQINTIEHDLWTIKKKNLFVYNFLNV